MRSGERANYFTSKIVKPADRSKVSSEAVVSAGGRKGRESTAPKADRQGNVLRQGRALQNDTSNPRSATSQRGCTL